jgi:hypothetical protein
MLTMAVGHSDDVDAGLAIAAAIEQCRSALAGRIPTAGMLLSVYETFDPSLVAAVRAAFPGVHIMGSTSAAEVSSIAGFLEDSVTLALFASDTADVTTGLGVGLGVDVDAACRAAVTEARPTAGREPKLGVVFAEGFVEDPQVTLDAMARALPPGVVLVGGGSARRDLETLAPTYQFCDDRIVQDGVVLLLFSGPVAFSVAVGTGYRGLGPPGVVTRSQRGVVGEIDGRPAIEFLAPYLDDTGPASLGNPLAVAEAGTDRSYLRAIVRSDPATGAVTLFGSVPVGATVQLTTANTDDILAGTRDALARATADFPADAHPEAALMFSCMVRKSLLGSKTRVEAELAGAEFGSAFPLVGLYCAGEVGPIRGDATSSFLNQTFVTVLLGT